MDLNLDEDVDVDLDPNFLKFLRSDSYSDFGYILAEDKTIPKESETPELKDISHKNFYIRDSQRLRMKIEVYISNLVPAYEQHIKNELHILQKYIDDILKKNDWLRSLDEKSYDYECMVLTIKELYDRVTHQFEEYYELNHTYKLYTYKGEYKQFVYSYDQLILSYKKQFDSCITTINDFIVKLD